jgi:hypothetical protein
MRVLPLALLVLGAAIAAGCTNSPQPAGAAGSSGASTSTATLAGFRCPTGSAVVGFDASGAAQCGSPWTDSGTTTPATPSPAPTRSLSLSSAGPILNGKKTYTVASVTPGTYWSDVTLTLNGTALTYDGTLTAARSFCVSTTGGSCIETASWSPSGSFVAGGETVTVSDKTLAGETLRVVDAHTDATILTLVVS